jgi:sphinganine-1-phosphate aldolase
MVGLVALPNSTSIAAIRTRTNALLQSTLISRAKTILLFYVLLVQYLKFSRHLRARGVRTSVSELYTWISQVHSSF